MTTKTPGRGVAGPETPPTEVHPDPAPITAGPATCQCGHFIASHHLTPRKIRTYCTHMDPAGACPCKQANCCALASPHDGPCAHVCPDCDSTGCDHCDQGLVTG